MLNAFAAKSAARILLLASMRVGAWDEAKHPRAKGGKFATAADHAAANTALALFPKPPVVTIQATSTKVGRGVFSVTNASTNRDTGEITLNTGSTQFQAALKGNPIPLGGVIAHEMWHVANAGTSDECGAYDAQIAFLVTHGADKKEIREVEKAKSARCNLRANTENVSDDYRIAVFRGRYPARDAADREIARMESACRYAFATARAAYVDEGEDAAIEALEYSLGKTLTPALQRTYLAGAAAAVDRFRTAGGQGSGNFGHSGRPGEVGGSSGSFGSSDEQRVVQEYTYESEHINSGLRAGKPLEPIEQATVSTLDRLMKPTDHDMRVYRVMPLDVMGELYEGAEFTDNGFFSATKSSQASRQYVDVMADAIGGDKMQLALVTVDIPAGTPVIDVNAVVENPHFPEQREIILARGTSYNIISFTKSANGFTRARVWAKNKRHLGGQGSGNYGHGGRPGEVGGSEPGSGGRIEDGTFKSGDKIVYKGKPGIFISSTLKHREIEIDGKRLFVTAFRVKKAEESGENLETVRNEIDSMLGGRGARKKLTIDVVNSMPVEKLKKLHEAYSKAHSIATGTDKWSYFATKSMLASTLKDRGVTVLGGQGSGNYGHSGRPGEVGGSTGDGLFTDTEDAVMSYALGSYGLAERLRKGKELTPIDVSKIKLMDAAMKPLAAQTVYRGVTPTYAKTLKEGTEFTDLAYTSVTKDYEVSADYGDDEGNAIQLIIDLPAGTQGIDINKTFESAKDAVQKEIVLARGTVFRVKDTSDFGEDFGAITLEIVSQPKILGGQGSGNYGHRGRPGEVGGSGEGGSRIEDFPDDQHLHSPGDAVVSLLQGERVTIAREDVRTFLKKSLEESTPVDLTDVRVEGHLIFGGEGLGINRADMPQIPKEMREQFLKEAKEHGITSRRGLVDPLTLKPTQNEISTQNVALKLAKYEKDPYRWFPPIIVSDEGRVLDGHHHWGMMAALRVDNPKIRIPITRLSSNVKDSLKEMHAFDKRHHIEREAIKVNEAWRMAKLLVVPTVHVMFTFGKANERAEEWAREHAGELIKGISRTTRDRIRVAVSTHGPKATKEIAAAIGDADRAKVITRTETIRASAEGQLGAWLDAQEKGLLPKTARREWIMTPEEACPICRELDGKRVKLDDPFILPNGDLVFTPPAHPNCRCAEGIAAF